MTGISEKERNAMRKTKRNDFITFLQLARYSTNTRIQGVTALGMLICAIAMEVVCRGKNVVGGVFFTAAIAVVSQQLVDLDNSTLVQSSPYKKKLQIHYPYMLLVPTVLLIYTLLILVHVWMIAHPLAGMTISQNYHMQATYILTLGFFLFLGEIYFGFCYKYYLQASGILIFIVMPVCSFLNVVTNYDIWSGANLQFSIIAGYLLIIVGLVLSVIFSNLCYKKPLSVTAFKGILGRK